MDPTQWRQKVAKISLRELARRLSVRSPQTVRRYETGERETPNSVALAWENESRGEDGIPLVKGEDLARVRRIHLQEKAAA